MPAAHQLPTRTEAACAYQTFPAALAIAGSPAHPLLQSHHALLPAQAPSHPEFPPMLPITSLQLQPTCFTFREFMRSLWYILMATGRPLRVHTHCTTLLICPSPSMRSTVKSAKDLHAALEQRRVSQQEAG